MNVNRLAAELLGRNPDSFSTDFKYNRDMISKQIVLSAFVRNQVAGRITRIKKRKGQKPLPVKEPRVEEPRRPRR